MTWKEQGSISGSSPHWLCQCHCGEGRQSVSPGARVSAAHAPKARPRMTTLSSMASRKKRVISHRIWTEAEHQPGPSPPPRHLPPSLSCHHTLSATVAASEALTVMDTTARAIPTRATTNTWRAREGDGMESRQWQAGTAGHPWAQAFMLDRRQQWALAAGLTGSSEPPSCGCPQAWPRFLTSPDGFPWLAGWAMQSQAGQAQYLPSALLLGPQFPHLQNGVK